jgi:cAMP-dependent protein kinase regulator
VTRFSSRRKSVFAETYNPEEDDDDDEGAKVSSPQTVIWQKFILDHGLVQN